MSRIAPPFVIRSPDGRKVACHFPDRSWRDLKKCNVHRASSLTTGKKHVASFAAQVTLEIARPKDEDSQLLLTAVDRAVPGLDLAYPGPVLRGPKVLEVCAGRRGRGAESS